jgi:hypothetical protein
MSRSVLMMARLCSPSPIFPPGSKASTLELVEFAFHAKKGGLGEDQVWFGVAARCLMLTVTPSESWPGWSSGFRARAPAVSIKGNHARRGKNFCKNVVFGNAKRTGHIVIIGKICGFRRASNLDHLRNLLSTRYSMLAR